MVGIPVKYIFRESRYHKTRWMIIALVLDARANWITSVELILGDVVLLHLKAGFGAHGFDR